MAIIIERLAEMHGTIPLLQQPDVLLPVSFSLGIAASETGAFKKALFIRDMQRTTEDELAISPEPAEKTLNAAAYTQGTTEDPTSDQEPDKIIHEFRDASLLTDDDRQELQGIFEELRHWTNTPPEEEVTRIRYYGGYDPTVNHAIVAEKYVNAYPSRAKVSLDLPIVHIDGEVTTIRKSIYKSVAWVERKMLSHSKTIPAIPADSEDVPTYLAYKRMKDTGIPHPIWKDSNLSGIHPDGTPANVDNLIVDTHLQTLAISSLISGANLKRLEASELSDAHKKEALLKEAESWEKLAFRTHCLIEKELWMNDENYPSLGQDRDQDGNIRQIKTFTSGGMEILHTRFFDKRFWQGREKERLEKIAGIVDRITDTEYFLTDGGPSVLSLKHEDLVEAMGYIPYHSIVVWAKNVKEGIDGLREQGLYQTALGMSYLLRRNIAIYQAVHNNPNYFPEFSYLKKGKILYNIIRLPQQSFAADAETINGTNIPVDRQTWTASAVESEERYISKHGNEIPPYESEDLQNIDERNALKLALFIDSLPPIQDEIEYAKQHPVYINIEEGIRKEAEYRAKFALQKKSETVVVYTAPQNTFTDLQAS